MNFAFRLILPAVCLWFAAAGAHANDDNDVDRVGENDPVIDALFSHWDQPGSPGCAVAISKDSQLIYSRGYGYANLDYSIPISRKTVFDVASVTKQFVAASLSMLELDGKLSFQDDVRKYLPELPVYEQPITLSHMVYHTSGLRDYLKLFPLAGRDDYFPISHPQILDMMSRQRELVFAPGEDYLYSNTAYMLLAQVIERVSGQSLGDFIQQRIFDPRQMHDSWMYDDRERVIAQRAIGYERSGDNVRVTHNYNFDVVGDGQMYTTVEDLIRWNSYLYGAEKPDFYDTIMLEGTLNSGEKLARAKGLFLDTYRGAATVHHTGGSWGFRTVVKRFTDSALTIVIACNDDSAYPRQIAFRIADYLLADELVPSVTDETAVDESIESVGISTAQDLTAEQRREFAGSYFSPELDAIYRISESQDGLAVRIEQEPPLPLVAVAADRLQFELQPAGWSGSSTVELDVVRSGSGKVSGFLLSAESERDIVFEKVDLPATGDLN